MAGGEFASSKYVQTAALKPERYLLSSSDIEQMPASEKDFYWRNELHASIGMTGQAAYAGHGLRPCGRFEHRVHGDTQLAGAVIGAKDSHRYALRRVWPRMFVVSRSTASKS